MICSYGSKLICITVAMFTHTWLARLPRYVSRCCVPVVVGEEQQLLFVVCLLRV